MKGRTGASDGESVINAVRRAAGVMNVELRRRGESSPALCPPPPPSLLPSFLSLRPFLRFVFASFLRFLRVFCLTFSVFLFRFFSSVRLLLLSLFVDFYSLGFVLFCSSFSFFVLFLPTLTFLFPFHFLSVRHFFLPFCPYH